MSGMFPIIEVSAASQGDVEQMGSKPKFWFRRGEERWLFKEAREHTGEDWAEKLSSEIARLLGLSTHETELASAHGKRGVAVHSFLNPSSAVIGAALLVINDLRFKSEVFLHYILHELGASGQLEAEVGE